MTIASQQFRLTAYAGFGAANNDMTLLDYQEAVASTANGKVVKNLTLNTSTTDTAFTFTTELDTAILIIIRDVTPNAPLGVSYQIVTGAATQFKLAPGGVAIMRQFAGTAPPTLYFSNSDPSNKAYIEVCMIGTKT